MTTSNSANKNLAQVYSTQLDSTPVIIFLLLEVRVLAFSFSFLLKMELWLVSDKGYTLLYKPNVYNLIL